jgi:hypothetical protein
MPKKIKETTLTKKFIGWLNDLPRTYAEKRHAGPGRKGKPDVTGASHGIRFEIEVKTPGNKPTRLQSWWINKWQSVGVVAFWDDTLDGLKNSFRQAMIRRGIKIK